MAETFLFGRELHLYAERVGELAAEARTMRLAASHDPPLRDTGMWMELRRAQDWIARRNPPHRAWQGERVRRTLLQLGHGRPVLEGQNMGSLRSMMACFQLTQQIVVFPEGIVGCTTSSIATGLIHEATHIVHREVLCERMGLTIDEAFVLCDMNARERPRTIFTGEALAFWNQAAWLRAYAAEELADGKPNRMPVHAARMITRPSDAVEDFAAALMYYTECVLMSEQNPLDLPFVHPFGDRAGWPIVVSDLAHSILEPLLAEVDDGYDI